MNTIDLNNAIRESATIVTLNTRSWTARARDDMASAAAAEAAGADPRAYSSHKNLMFSADEKLRAVRAAQASARDTHMQMTLPWGTDENTKGIRMLPVARLQEYMGKIGKARKDFSAKLDDFLESYEEDKAKAMAALNITGGESLLYPKKDSLESRFILRVEFQPIPAGTEFKGLPDGLATRLAESYEERMAEKMNKALQAAFQRSHDALEAFSERVLGSRMRKSSWENVTVLPSMLRGFNVINDYTTEQLASSIETNLTAVYDIEDVKRAANKQQVSEIAKQLAGEARELIDYEEVDTE